MRWISALTCLVALLCSTRVICDDEKYKKYYKRTGKKFLASKAEEAGVYKLPSGMLIEILEKGAREGGRSPKEDDTTSCHYHGTLRGGEVFDSSVERNVPASFAPNQVIAGWTEAMQVMCEGDKWRLFIPYELAYGERGSPPKIPPFSPLVFELEMLEVKGDGGKPCDHARKELLEKIAGSHGDAAAQYAEL